MCGTMDSREHAWEYLSTRAEADKHPQRMRDWLKKHGYQQCKVTKSLEKEMWDGSGMVYGDQDKRIC